MKKSLIFLFSIAIIFSACKTKHEFVVMETSLGKMKIKLYDSTILHNTNFVKLVNEGYYNGQLFHRVINNFMIQAGDSNSINAAQGVSLGHGGKNYTIAAEFFPEYYHKKGALAAARQGDNVNPNKESSGSQFYIVQGKIIEDQIFDAMVQRGIHPAFTEDQKQVYSTIGGTPHLDYAYTVFGEVIEGIEIIDIIAKVETGQGDRPLKDVKIIKMYTVKK